MYYGLFAPWVAWGAEQLTDFALASHACFPAGESRAAFLEGWHGVWSVMLAINIALLVISAAGMATSLLSWRRLWREQRHKDEHHWLLEPGEGRVRVFAASGFLVSLLFTIAIIFNTISLTALSTCSQA